MLASIIYDITKTEPRYWLGFFTMFIFFSASVWLSYRDSKWDALGELNMKQRIFERACWIVGWVCSILGWLIVVVGLLSASIARSRYADLSLLEKGANHFSAFWLGRERFCDFAYKWNSPWEWIAVFLLIIGGVSLGTSFPFIRRVKLQARDK